MAGRLAAPGRGIGHHFLEGRRRACAARGRRSGRLPRHGEDDGRAVWQVELEAARVHLREVLAQIDRAQLAEHERLAAAPLRVVAEADGERPQEILQRALELDPTNETLKKYISRLAK